MALAEILGLSYIESIRDYTPTSRQEKQDRIDKLEL
jgi:hypothetical protein